MKQKRFKGFTAGQLALTLLLTAYALVCLLPLLLIVAVSFSSEESVQRHGFQFIPTEWSLKAFEYIGGFGHQILVSYGVTIFVTVTGVVLGLLIMSSFAYALSRRDFMMRKVLAFLLLFTMLFSGGQLAGYMVGTTVYHLKDSLLALIIPGLMGATNVIIMRTFIQTNVPDSIIESAKIDGAGDFYTFFRIVLPIMVPALAAVGFILAIAYWNDWNAAFLYIESPNKTPLQLLLIRMEKNVDFLMNTTADLPPELLRERKNLPQETSRMATLLVATGPIMFAYPFFQKYFIKGLTIGSVKG